MAWNKYYIVVANQQQIAPEDIIAKLGLTGYHPAGEATFIETNKSDDLFIGSCAGSLIIANPELTSEMFAAVPTETERKLVGAFPDAEIAAFIENSTVNAFGYVIIQNGRRIRIKDGCDGEIYNDNGGLLAEEETILSAPIFDPEDLDEMREEMEEEEVEAMVKFEASWRAPTEIAKRYFGGISIENVEEGAIKLIRYKRA